MALVYILCDAVCLSLCCVLFVAVQVQQLLQKPEILPTFSVCSRVSGLDLELKATDYRNISGMMCLVAINTH